MPPPLRARMSADSAECAARRRPSVGRIVLEASLIVLHVHVD